MVDSGMQDQSARRLHVLAGQLAPGPKLFIPTPGPIAANSTGTLKRQPCSSELKGDMLAGRVAIITGAGNGIGEAAAKLFAAQGAAVVVCDLDGAAAQRVAQQIQESGGRAVGLSADVTLSDAPAKVVAAAVDNFGGVDILVNNAGFTWDGVIQKMTAKQWDTMLMVHCTAPFRFIQAVEPYMRGAGKKELDAGGQARSRHIINISSTTGTHGNAGQTNYATAKAGVLGLSKSVAKEWGPYGVRCNAIAFGLIDTRLTRSKEDGQVMVVDGQKVALGIPNADNYWAQIKQQIPLRRTGSADEAAGVIMMMVSPWASYITGQVIEVNGGSFM